MPADLGPIKVVQAIRRDHPDGARFFTNGGKRVEEPKLYPWKRGWKSLIDGQWHCYDREGRFVSCGEANYRTDAPSSSS